MQPVVGVFANRAAAERLMGPLQALGLPKEHLSLLSPDFPEKEIEAAPMMDTERPLMGKVLGGLVGFAVAGGGGLLGTGLMGIVIPGVGPVVTIGTVAVALLAVAGAVGGAEVGSLVEHAFTSGVPKDEVFVYEDALRKGRTVLIALADDDEQAEAVHLMLEQSGAESIDRARDNWWMGLRAAEEAHYTARGGDFAADESAYRHGFEAALHPETHGKSIDDAVDYLREHYPYVYDQESFRLGYERGQAYDRQVRELAAQKGC